MKKGKKFLILLGIMLVAIFTVGLNRVSAATINNVNTFTELENALTSTSTDTINITGNITVTKTITVGGAKTVKGAYTLTNGVTVATGSGASSAANNMFTVPAGKSLTLDGGLTLNGNNKTTATSSVIVNSGTVTLKNVRIKNGTCGVYGQTTAAATINIESGAVIDNTNKTGVISYSKVNMNGGTISAKNIGIQINGTTNHTNAILTMNGGTISGYDCDVATHAGISIVNGGALVINDGTIKNPISTDFPELESPNGYAVYYAGGSFKIKDITLGTNQSIYMVNDTGYIDIGTNKPELYITPAKFTRGRDILKVTLPSSATTATAKKEYYESIRDVVTINTEKGSCEWKVREDGNGYMELWEYILVMTNYLHEGSQFAPSVFEYYWAGEKYTTKAIQKQYYTLIKTPANASGTCDKEDVTVNYEYTKQKGKIRIKYIDDATGSEVPGTPEKLIEGFIEEEYECKAEEIDGYKLMDKFSTVTKVFGEEEISVEFHYLKSNKCTIRYIDEETGEEIPDHDVIEMQYVYGETFDQKIKDEIYGYHYDKTEITGASGTTMEGRDVVVTHYYLKNSQVIVKYIDKFTKQEIKLPKIEEGYYGKAYTTEPIEIEGYAYNGNADDHTDNTSGSMINGVITVEYYYVKLVDITIRYVSKETNANISGYPPVTVTYQQGQEIDRKQIEIPGYTYQNSSTDITVAGADEVTIIHYYSSESKVVVKHLDKFNHDIQVGEDFEIPGIAGKEYSTNPLNPVPEGYVYRQDNSGNTRGQMNSSLIVVEYYYIKRVPVTVRYIDATTQTSISGHPDIVTTYDQGEVFDQRYLGNVGSYTYVNTVVEGADGNKVGAEPITVTHYYGENADIVVNHVDLNDRSISIASPRIVTGYIGSTYRTQPLSGADLPTNYIYSGKYDGETEGTITGQAKTITYYYIKQIPVTIKYVNQNTGETIQEDKTIYSQGDTFDIKKKDISGYKYIRTENPKGDTTVGTEDIVVTHYYTKDAAVVMKHLDKADHSIEIADPTYLYGSAGETYNAEPLRNLPARYVYRGDNSGNTNGTFDDNEIEVQFYYTRQAQVTVNYVDQVTGATLESVSDSYDQNQVIDKKQKNIENYKYLSTVVEGDVNGKVGTEDVTVTHYYAKDAKVVVKYLDKYHNELTVSAGYEIPGYEGMEYVANKLEYTPENYVYREDNSGNTTGKMVAGTTEVIYYYIRRIPVTIRYVDNATKVPMEQIRDIYDENTEFDKKAKEIDNYTYLSENVVGTTNNIVGQDDITVTHYYGRNTSVLVKHLDKNNKKITVADEVLMPGYEGMDYTALVAESIPENYKYEEDNSGNITGQMSREQTQVEFYYVKQVPVTVKYVDVNTGESIREVKDIVDETSSLNRRERTFDNYTYLRTEVEGTDNEVVGPNDVTVTHYYAKNTSVVVKYLDQYHNEIEVGQSVTIPGYVGLDYQTYKLEQDPEGYAYRELNTGNISGVMQDGVTVVEYYYVKQVPVTVNYVDKYEGTVLETTTDIYDEATLYDKKEKDIEGYAYSDTVIDGTHDDTVGPNDITVTHNYIKESTVTVRYVDANTQQDISTPLVTVQKQNDVYVAYAIDIPGFLLSEEESSKEVTVGRENIEIIFYYKGIAKETVVKYIDGITKDLLDIEHFDGKVGDYIIAETKDIPGYALVDEPAVKRVQLKDEYQELVFVYYKRVEITVKGIIQELGRVEWQYTMTGLEGQPYSTTYQKIEGFHLVNTKDSITGVYDRNVNEIIYYYSKDDLKGDVNLDGLVNSTDAALVLDCYKNDTTTDELLQRGDMNDDGILNSTDAAMILDVYKQS